MADNNNELYVGVSGKARSFSDLWVGINGKARKVNAMWLGENGVARKIYPKSQWTRHYHRLDTIADQTVYGTDSGYTNPGYGDAAIISTSGGCFTIPHYSIVKKPNPGVDIGIVRKVSSQKTWYTMIGDPLLSPVPGIIEKATYDIRMAGYIYNNVSLYTWSGGDPMHGTISRTSVGSTMNIADSESDKYINLMSSYGFMNNSELEQALKDAMNNYSKTKLDTTINESVLDGYTRSCGKTNGQLISHIE